MDDRPACNALASLVIVEVTIAPDAAPGQREMTAGHAARGVEPAGLPRRPTAGVFAASRWSRPVSRCSARRSWPCASGRTTRSRTASRCPAPLNGQIASGEVNRYRFEARKGQRLVISTQARNLVPFIADAVPGWFQPVLALYDAQRQGGGLQRRLPLQARPGDPLRSAQGRRIRAGDHRRHLPRTRGFRLSHHHRRDAVRDQHLPAGRPGRATPASIADEGLEPRGGRARRRPRATPGRGSTRLAAHQAGSWSPTACPSPWTRCRNVFEKEPNNDPAHAQKVKLPVIINGRIDRPDDWDVFQFTGHAGETIVAEVYARRLDSPLDSRAQAHRRRRQAAGLQRRPRRPGGRDRTRTTPIPTSWPSCPPTGRTTSTWATPRGTAARSMPTGCGSARRGPISPCASCRPASACAARPAAPRQRPRRSAKTGSPARSSWA